MPSKKSVWNRDFQARVREYLPMEAVAWGLDAGGKPAVNALTSGLNENTFYLFDAEAMLAVGHAIEDLALDAAAGRLLAVFQEFKQFEPMRERYWQLGATLDEVQVLGYGRKPARNGRVKYGHLGQSPLKDFWVVLYEGRRQQALLFCRQVNKTGLFEEKKFVGFYTFDLGLPARVRQEIADCLRGRCRGLLEFHRLLALDRAYRLIQGDFTREQQAVESAIRKLQVGGGRYHARHFATDLSRGLARLARWETRLPAMLDAVGAG